MENYLVIEMDQETSVPRVFYKGQEITNKLGVNFTWETSTTDMGGTELSIEHAVLDGPRLMVNTISERFGRFAFVDFEETVLRNEAGETVARQVETYLDSEKKVIEGKQ